MEHLDDLEDLHLAKDELKKIKAGAKTYTLDEIRNELGMDD